MVRLIRLLKMCSCLLVILLIISCDQAPSESHFSDRAFIEGNWIGVAQYLDDTVRLDLKRQGDSVFGKIEVGRTFTWPTPEIDGKVSGKVIDQVDEKIRLTAWPDSLLISDAKARHLTISVELTPDVDKNVMRGSYSGWDLRMERE